METVLNAIRRPIFRNVWVSIVQVIVTGVSLFIFYRYLLETIGVAKVGIWSVVLATASATRIGELGLSGSAVKFVAKYLVRGDMQEVGNVIQTAVISTAILLGTILVAGFPFFRWLLPYIMPADALPEAMIILPWALISLWLMAVAGVFHSGLDGCQRIDLRGGLLIGSSLLSLLFAVLLVPRYGLAGLAYGQVIQAALMLAVSWLLLRRELPVLPPVPWRWSKARFGEMLAYGVNFQVASIGGMLFEPITKALLSKFGGLSMTGYYEMANRMVYQFRTLLVSANQVLVPVIAGLIETSPERVVNVYRESYRLMFYLSVPLFFGILAAAPVISRVWIGYYEDTFVIFTMILAVAWFFNLLIYPAYFTNQGTGQLLWNTVTHVAVGVLNLIFGLILGTLYGGMGVVAACALALIAGGSLVVIFYHRDHRIPMRELVPQDSPLLFLAVAVGAAACLSSYYIYFKQWSHLLADALCLMIFILIAGPACWFHPMRHRLLRWIAPGTRSKQIQDTI